MSEEKRACSWLFLPEVVEGKLIVKELRNDLNLLDVAVEAKRNLESSVS